MLYISTVQDAHKVAMFLGTSADHASPQRIMYFEIGNKAYHRGKW